LGAPLHLLGRGLPDGRWPVGLLSLKDPERSFGQMASHSADGDGVALALTDLIVDPADVPGFPGGVVPMADDDIGRLDEGPLEVLVGGLAHVAEASSAAAGVDGGDDSGVAGQSA